LSFWGLQIIPVGFAKILRAQYPKKIVVVGEELPLKFFNLKTGLLALRLGDGLGVGINHVEFCL